jgi:hypothetical protein
MTTPARLVKADAMQRRLSAKLSQQRGEFAEECAVRELLRMGAVRAERLATPVRKIRGRLVRTRKVLADIVGWWPGGRVLLCEVKCRYDNGFPRRPTRCCFEDHQLANLKACDDAGGNGLVAWMSPGGILIEPARNWYA